MSSAIVRREHDETQSERVVNARIESETGESQQRRAIRVGCDVSRSDERVDRDRTREQGSHVLGCVSRTLATIDTEEAQLQFESKEQASETGWTMTCGM